MFAADGMELILVETVFLFFGADAVDEESEVEVGLSVVFFFFFEDFD